METQQFMLSNYINTNTTDNILKNLYDNHQLMSKDYPETNMVILYNKYENKHKSRLEMECRSVILDRTTFKIICYSCPTPIYNMEAVNYMWKNQHSTKETYVCYEGSLISLFNYNETWYAASRKCIYSKETEESGQYKMFMDVIRKDGYTDLDSFTKLLDNTKSYHFVLIHHLNENIVNYKKEFGDNYMKLCFIFARNIVTQEEYNSENIDCVNLSDNIFLPKKIEDGKIQDITQHKTNTNMLEQPSNEGVIIKMNNNILKLQNPSYQFHKAIGSDKNMYRGFLCLYQNNTLKQYLDTNTNTDKFRKIVNPLNTTESYDMIGMIDALFKVITCELLYLFNILYDNDGNQKDQTLYLKLPDEYKTILFQIRGILFANKKRKQSFPPASTDLLEIKDIYNLLKSIEVKVLESFIRCRKLMLNWIKLEKNDDTRLFTNSLYHSDKIFYKLISIYTIKLFPEIMQDDTPWKSQINASA